MKSPHGGHKVNLSLSIARLAESQYINLPSLRFSRDMDKKGR